MSLKCFLKYSCENRLAVTLINFEMWSAAAFFISPVWIHGLTKLLTLISETSLGGFMSWSCEICFISLCVKNDLAFATEISFSRFYYTTKLHTKFVKMWPSYCCGYLCLMKDSWESLRQPGHFVWGKEKRKKCCMLIKFWLCAKKMMEICINSYIRE